MTRGSWEDSNGSEESSSEPVYTSEVGKAIDNFWRGLSNSDHEDGTPDENDPTIGALLCPLFNASGSASNARSQDDFPQELIAYGTAMYSLFEESRSIQGINEAISCWGLAAPLIPDSHEDKAGVFSGLGHAYHVRFQNLNELEDLYYAIEYGERGVSLLDDENTDKPSALNNLGISYRARFVQLGNLIDLNEAIHCGERASLLAPEGHVDRPSVLANLGNSYLDRSEALGIMCDLWDINQAIDCAEQALLLTSNDDTDMPIRLTHLGLAYLARFNHMEEAGDLDKAVSYSEQSLLVAPDNHVGKLGLLNNLIIAYNTQYEFLGDLLDLNRLIEKKAEAVLLTPDGHPSKPSRLDSLGKSYVARFRRLGQLSDINDSINCGAQAVYLTPNGQGDRPPRLNQLGISFLTRFIRLGKLSDLDKATYYLLQASSLIPESHQFKATVLSNLGASYRIRFESLGELTDLYTTIELETEAVLLASDADPHKPGGLSNLGTSYLIRFEHLGDLADLHKSIQHKAAGVELTPDGHADMPSRLNNLGTSYLTRFNCLGEVPDIDQAIDCSIKALSLTPNDSVDKTSRLHNLGLSYRARYNRLHVLSDLESAINSFKNASELVSGPPFARFNAFRSWAYMASRHSASSPHPAYQQAMELLPQLIWIGTSLDRRYHTIVEVGDFATEAASHAISIGNYELALEWLEAGRSIVWSQIARLRTPFDQLLAQSQELASRLKEIGLQLERAEIQTTSIFPLEDEVPGKDVGDRVQLALEWDTLLARARSISGFEHFLRPLKSARLLEAAKSHPIVAINIHESRCDALIIQPNSSTISHVPLPDFTLANAITAHKRLASQARQRKPGHLKSIGLLEGLLRDLWFNVLEPILEFLGYTQKLPIEELPRLTWCTTGVLSFLPLHAAGCHDGSRPNVFDLVISSYTPTLSSLLTKQQVTPGGQCGLLGIGQEHTPGLSSLPYTKDELAAVQRHASRCSYLQLESEEATVGRVLDAMEQFNWVHMACHGSQDPTDPTQSAFHLHDGSLTLASISKRSFHNKGLAFLSACQTATGHQDLPDEAVHLAAGMSLAGYPSVIATMWTIADEDGPPVADLVYEELLKDGSMNSTKAARALHRAVGCLRARVGAASFERWAPFIHIGA